jgi:hypothetical protein
VDKNVHKLCMAATKPINTRAYTLCLFFVQCSNSNKIKDLELNTRKKCGTQQLTTFCAQAPQPAGAARGQPVP